VTPALKYHPDRNPGHEAEVNSKFQTIQSAHEVLTDPEQRAKYDNGRLRNSTTRTYSGFGAPPPAPSGTRGNPWANAGSEWAPPPKPPPPRDHERRKPPPPSAGAQRYANFATSNGTAPKANQDAEARRKNYQAWESMRQQAPRTYQPSKPVPKEYTPQSGREESNNYKHPPPPKSSRPGYEEFRAGASSSQSDRTSPTRPSRKGGFMPGTPGPDEPPASSTSAYFTRAAGKSSSRRQAEVPEPPPRTVPPVDPLKQFREKAGTPLEPRLSTPYATHGGEKTNPFERINLNRSRSTREPSDKTNSARAEPSRPGASGDRHRSASPPRTRPHQNISPEPGIPRADSEINLGSSPKRTFSSANRTNQPSPSPRPRARFTSVDPNISSDGDDSDSDKHQPAFGTRSRTFAKRRTAPTTALPKESQGGPENSTGENDERPRKPSLAEFRQWWSSSEEHKRNELNDIKIDGTPSRHGTANRDNGKDENPSMYATPSHSNTFSSSAAKRASPLPTLLEEHSIQSSNRHIPQASHKIAASSEAFAAVRKQWPNLVTPMTNDSPPRSPSGAPNLTPPGFLTAFEVAQRQVVENLVRCNGFKPKLTGPAYGGAREPCSKDLGARITRATLPRVVLYPPEPSNAKVPPNLLFNHDLKRAEFSECPCGCSEMGSPFRKQRRGAWSHPDSSLDAEFTSFLNPKTFINADGPFTSSFSFNANDETFTSSRPPRASFSNSAENISTKFTAEDWHGKFEAGDYFVNDGTSGNGRSRTRSGSRTRTRSPVKGWATKKSQAPPIPNIDPEIWQQTTDSEPISSPGGTKFTAEEWARTFKPQHFDPPSYPSGSTTARPPLRTARRSRTGTNGPPKTTRTAGNSAMVDEDESSESPFEMGRRTTQPTATPQADQGVPSSGMDSPNAMDIDPPLDQQSDTPKARQNGFTASKDSVNEARNVPVEPSRPEWRAGDASGSDVPPVAQKQPELPPKSGNVNSRRRTTKSADEEDFKTNLEDLKNVEPLHHPATGLHSFNDLTSSLPFPSRAASNLTIPHDFSSGELDLPHPPCAPMVPPITKGARPSMSTWESYLLAFKAYMAEWDIFNTKMIIHFVARKNQVDAMKPGWLEAFGDSDLDKYKEGLMEDFKVRAHWDVACDHHQAAMEKFQVFKRCIKEGPGIEKVH
jgi:curved DNA-binding protein CbpA